MADDGVFPLLDRRAPLVERVRGKGPLSNGEKAEPDSSEVAELVIEVSTIQDSDAKKEVIEEAKEDFRASLADSAQVDEEMINDGVVEAFGGFLNNSEGDIVSEEGLKKLGLLADDSDEPSEEGEEDSVEDLMDEIDEDVQEGAEEDTDSEEEPSFAPT